MTSQKRISILFVILIFSLIIRLAGIQSRPIWYDEAFSILLVENGPQAIFNTVDSGNLDASAAEEHPPLYYLSLWAWFKIFGASIISARMFSVFISILVIFLIYGIAESLFDAQTALVSATIAGALPFQIHYSQEIRMYALLSLFLLTATFAFVRVHTQNWKWWILFTVSSALAQYTHNLAAFYLLPLAFIPILQKDQKKMRALIIAGCVAFILYLPWVAHLPSQLSKVNSYYWVQRPGFDKLFVLILFYLPHLPLPGISLPIGLMATGIVVSFTIYQTILGLKNRLSSSSNGLLVAYLAFIPPLFLWLTSQLIPIYIERALLASHAIFCIWLGWATIQANHPRFIQTLVTTLVITSASMGICQHITYRGFPYGPFEKISKSLDEQLLPGDIIVHSSKLSYLPLDYFNSGLPQAYIIDPPKSNVDTLAPATREILGLSEFENIEDASKTTNRIWFIIFKRSIEEYLSAGYKSHPEMEYLTSHFTLQKKEEWDDLTIFLFKREP